MRRAPPGTFDVGQRGDRTPRMPAGIRGPGQVLANRAPQEPRGQGGYAGQNAIEAPRKSTRPTPPKEGNHKEGNEEGNGKEGKVEGKADSRHEGQGQRQEGRRTSSHTNSRQQNPPNVAHFCPISVFFDTLRP